MFIHHSTLIFIHSISIIHSPTDTHTHMHTLTHSFIQRTLTLTHFLTHFHLGPGLINEQILNMDSSKKKGSFKTKIENRGQPRPHRGGGKKKGKGKSSEGPKAPIAPEGLLMVPRVILSPFVELKGSIAPGVFTFGDSGNQPGKSREAGDVIVDEGTRKIEEEEEEDEDMSLSSQDYANSEGIYARREVLESFRESIECFVGIISDEETATQGTHNSGRDTGINREHRTPSKRRTGLGGPSPPLGNNVGMW